MSSNSYTELCVKLLLYVEALLQETSGLIGRRMKKYATGVIEYGITNEHIVNKCHDLIIKVDGANKAECYNEFGEENRLKVTKKAHRLVEINAKHHNCSLTVYTNFLLKVCLENSTNKKLALDRLKSAGIETEIGDLDEWDSKIKTNRKARFVVGLTRPLIKRLEKSKGAFSMSEHIERILRPAVGLPISEKSVKIIGHKKQIPHKRVILCAKNERR